MYGDNRSTEVQSATLSPQMLYRGLYVRIARKLRVDPSYVSRVARGERHSTQIESALHEELQAINRRLEGRSAPGKRPMRPSRSVNRFRALLRRNRSHIRRQWLRHSQADPNLRKIKIAPQRRSGPILPVFDEALKCMKLSLKEMAAMPLRAARRHGRLRQAQGFSPSALIEEYNLVRRCVFNLTEEHLQQLEPRLLLHGLTQFGDALDLQSQRALENYFEAV